MNTNSRNYTLAIIAIILFIIATIIGLCRGDTVYVTQFQDVKVAGQGYVRIVFYKRNGIMEAYIHVQDQNGHQMIKQSLPVEVKNPKWVARSK